MNEQRHEGPGGRAGPRAVPDGPAVPALVTDVPVVVIATTAYSALGFARSLGRLGVPVYGVHPDARSAAARSRYWRRSHTWDLAAAPAARSVEWFLALGRSLSPRPLLVATDDAGCLFLADHGEALREAFDFPPQPPGLTRALSSKQQMYHLCMRHGVPTAETCFPRSRADVVRYAREARFPVMLKGIDTQALHRRVGRRMCRVEDAATLLALYDRWETPGSPNLMLQEFIPGGCERIWMLTAYFGAGSECRFAMSGRKLREYPAYSGVTSLGVVETNPEVLALTARFMRALGYRGILDLDYKLDERTGTYKALDANPRPGANFRLFVDRYGTDAARVLYRDLTGQPLPAVVPHEGRRWVVEDFDCAASARYVRDGALGVGAWLRSYRGVQEAAWFAADDPLPALARGGRVLAQVVRQALPTPAARMRATAGGRAR